MQEAHAILFIVLPLAVAWLAGASAYFPPYPAPKTDPESEPQFEADFRMFLAEHREPDAAAEWHMVRGVRGNELMNGAASAERLAANDLPSGAQCRADEGDLAA
ncbi:MAG TPA: hypothetical protein VK794_16260 [Steroidobacteraceae bacterium]|nr:hypothetical protein [Steroidobacteraceae bacterium]